MPKQVRKHKKKFWTFIVLINVVVTVLTVRSAILTGTLVTASLILHDWVATLI